MSIGWQVDPYRKQVLVYEPGKEVSMEMRDRFEGAGPVEGFKLNLARIWRRFRSS